MSLALENISIENLSVSFIYKKLPEEALYIYDWLVVDPDSFSFEDLKEKFYIKKRPKIIAYISIGEVEPERIYFKEIKEDWILGENKFWGTTIVDLRKIEYQEFLLNKVFAPLKDFDGFFLDTLESYKLVLSDKDFPSYEKALINFIKKLKTLYPDKIILINRGFEFYSEVKPYIDAVVAESLFYTFDQKTKEYKEVDSKESGWLLQRLKEVKNSGLPVIVIDYVPPYEKDLAKKIAKRIWEEGFIPYVSDVYLKTLGTSIYQLIPRKLLILFDSTQTEVVYTTTHRLYQVHLEYLGFVPEFYDISSGLPSEELTDLYAGIIIELGRVKDELTLFNWIEDQIKKGLKVFFVNTIPFPEDLLQKLDLIFLGVVNPFENIEIVEKTFSFFESKPVLINLNMIYPESGIPLLLMKYKNKIFSPLAITKWGGYAQEGALFTSSAGGLALFVFDPVEVFKAIFNPQFPAPDVTTENGRRILTIHIDGDNFFGKTDFYPQTYVGEIIRDNFIKRFPFPHTVSLIEGEVAPYGLYPEKSKDLESIAKSIFSLPNVEPASHSFSHPFFWSKGKEKIKEGRVLYYNLPIKDYSFNFEREIMGSVDYIKKLSNKDVKVFQWTGDCNPPEEAVALTYKAGIYNVNGGDTQIEAKKPYRVFIGPMGINKGSYFQIFAPIQNENIFTELWTQFYGYENVISTFQLTDNPYRYKPISIYHHFLSGQKLASLKALEKVYQYVLSQETNPKYLSEYAQRVLEFRNMALLIDIRDNNLKIRGEGNLRTLRFDSLVKVDIQKSYGVAGFKFINNSTYVHLSEKGDYKIIISNSDSPFYLVDTNGWIEKFENYGNTYKIWIKAYVPLEFRVYQESRCRVIINPKEYEKKSSGKVFLYRYRTVKEAYVEATCD